MIFDKSRSFQIPYIDSICHKDTIWHSRRSKKTWMEILCFPEFDIKKCYGTIDPPSKEWDLK
jgi:hypothetical protein